MIKKLAGLRQLHTYSFDVAIKEWLKSHSKKTGKTIGFLINEALIDYASKNGVTFQSNEN